MALDNRATAKASLVLPKTALTKSGVQFSPGETLWQYLDGTVSIYLNFQKLDDTISAEMLLSLKKTLVWYAEHKAPGTCEATFWDLCALFADVRSRADGPITELTDAELLSVRSTWRNEDGHDRRFGRCRPFLRRWHDFNYPGIHKSAAKFLNDVKLKSAPVGTRVTTMDPVKGPFTDMERESLLDAISSGYGHGLMSMREYVLAWLAALFGQRPTQYALLKLCDLVRMEIDGCVVHMLRLPLAKGSHERPRTRFQDVELIPELAELFTVYKAKVSASFSGLLDDPEQAPFFPSSGRRNKQNVDGLQYHSSSQSIGQLFKNTFVKLKTNSERTGKPIVVNIYRFRYTLGTNCIREGLGVDATAQRLGHATTDSVKPYVAVAKAYESLDRLDFNVAARLGVLAQAFKGTLITLDSEKDGDPSSHIVSPAIDESMDAPMGSCGKHSFCSFNKPIACYTCTLFRAWLDGPHEAVYSYLKCERNRLLSSGCDKTVLSINDRTMTAVAHVITMCGEEYTRRSALQEPSNG